MIFKKKLFKMLKYYLLGNVYFTANGNLFISLTQNVKYCHIHREDKIYILWLFIYLYSQRTMFRGIEESFRPSLCLYNIFREEHWKLLLHTQIAYHLRMFHNFDERSFGKVQGHLTKIGKFVSSPYFFYGEMFIVLT